MIQFVPIFLCIGAGAWLRRRDVLPGDVARGLDARVLYVALLLGLRGPVTQVAVFEASMAPMITAGIMAAEYKLGRRVANLMVGVGIVLSFATTALCWKVLTFFA